MTLNFQTPRFFVLAEEGGLPEDWWALWWRRRAPWREEVQKGGGGGGDELRKSTTESWVLVCDGGFETCEWEKSRVGDPASLQYLRRPRNVLMGSVGERLGCWGDVNCFHHPEYSFPYWMLLGTNVSGNVRVGKKYPSLDKFASTATAMSSLRKPNQPTYDMRSMPSSFSVFYLPARERVSHFESFKFRKKLCRASWTDLKSTGQGMRGLKTWKKIILVVH